MGKINNYILFQKWYTSRFPRALQKDKSKKKRYKQLISYIKNKK